MKRIHYYMVLLFILVLTTSCDDSAASTTPVNTSEVDKITITLDHKSESPDGISYSLKLKNSSKHVLIQNNVYLSYPIKGAAGSSENNFKAEAKGNKLNIRPDEEVILNVFAPRAEYEGNSHLDMEQFHLQLTGYLDELTDNDHFDKSGDISYFN